MDAREAYHRRAYRVALLLTDSRAAALSILERVARYVPSPERTSDARFDRAVIQASRPIHEAADRQQRGDGIASMFTLSEEAVRLWTSAHALEPQMLEAWVLREVEGLEPVRAARAMDCSRNAMERIHLLGAMRVLESASGDAYQPARDEIARALDTLDPTDALTHIQGVLKAHARRSRLITVLSVVVLLAFIGVLTFVLFDLLAWEAHESEVTDGAMDALSNPMPDAAAPEGAP